MAAAASQMPRRVGWAAARVRWRVRVALACIGLFWVSAEAAAQDAAPSASPCATPSPAAQEAIARRARLAAYYELNLALVHGRVLEWRGSGQRPRVVPVDAVHVAVGKARGYAIDTRHRVVTWLEGSQRIDVLLDDAALVSAGDSGLLAIRCDGSLWQRGQGGRAWSRSADEAVHAWVGDGADYYIAPGGRLFARGRAHRGQYGNGTLTEGAGWTPVAERAQRVVAHTGHALYLRNDGVLLGTGGNIYGPLGAHGYGDKADRWGPVFDGVRSMASGSRHSIAIRTDGTLWTWGSRAGPQPVRVTDHTVEAAAGMDHSIALDSKGRLWEWAAGEAPAALVVQP